MIVDLRSKHATVLIGLRGFILQAVYFLILGGVITFSFYYGMVKEVEYREQLRADRCATSYIPGYCDGLEVASR